MPPSIQGEIDSLNNCSLNNCAAGAATVVDFEILTDGFESGDTTAWSAP